MINDNFKISGTGEALLDLNDLRRVLMKNDNVQGFDTKCDEVLRSMTKLPDEDVLDNVYKKQLHFFEGSKPFMALYLQNPERRIGQLFSTERMPRRYVEQKMRDTNFNARNERSSSRESSLERKPKRKS